MLVKKNECIESSWSGGKTTQLFISPDSSSLEKRDFDYRISCATVNAEKSEFSQFPGYIRYLSIIKGDLKLSHDGDGFFDVDPIEMYCFDGSLPVYATGECEDFNLIVNKDTCIADIEKLFLTGERVYNDIKNAETFIYVFDGSLKVEGTNVNSGEGYFTKNQDVKLFADSKTYFYLVRIVKK